MTTVSVDITSGPGKLDLMLALFDRKAPLRREVEFKLAGEAEISAVVVITGVETRDGSGESWLFKGHVMRTNFGTYHKVHSDPRTVTGWYRTDTRNGRITLF